MYYAMSPSHAHVRAPCVMTQPYLVTDALILFFPRLPPALQSHFALSSFNPHPNRSSEPSRHLSHPTYLRLRLRPVASPQPLQRPAHPSASSMHTTLKANLQSGPNMRSTLQRTRFLLRAHPRRHPSRRHPWWPRRL